MVVACTVKPESGFSAYLVLVASGSRRDVAGCSHTPAPGELHGTCGEGDEEHEDEAVPAKRKRLVVEDSDDD